MEELKNISDFWNTAGQHIYSSLFTLHHQYIENIFEFLVKPFQPTSLSLEDKKSWQGSGNLSDSCWLGLLHIFSSIWQSFQSSSSTYPESALLITLLNPYSSRLFPAPYTPRPSPYSGVLTLNSSSLNAPIEALLTHHFAFLQPHINISWIC